MAVRPTHSIDSPLAFQGRGVRWTIYLLAVVLIASLFGVGQTAKVDTVLVRWPNGTEETFGPFPAGKIYTLREGGGG